MSLQRLLLRARTGREPRRIAQDTARFQSNILSFHNRNQVRLTLHTAAYTGLDDRNRSSPQYRSANTHPRRYAESSATGRAGTEVVLLGSCSPFATPSQTARCRNAEFSTLRLRLIRSPPASSRTASRVRLASPPLPEAEPLPRPARSPRPARTLNRRGKESLRPSSSLQRIRKSIGRQAV